MIVGVLLAAGKGTRFGGEKLLADLGDGQCVAEVACSILQSATEQVIAIVRPDAVVLAQRLAATGAIVRAFEDAKHGMGASLAWGVRQAADADGWLIALADMPLISRSDTGRVAAALRSGAALAAPNCQGRQGHPVGFSRAYYAELTALDGDHGARQLLAKYHDRLVDIPVSDARTWLDVDSRDDLERVRSLYQSSLTSG